MRRIMSLALSSTLVAALVVACSNNGSKNSAGGSSADISKSGLGEVFTTDSYKTINSYQFSQNGCDTGAQAFSDRIDTESGMPEICVGLQNDAKNNNCAPDLREAHFRKLCAGYTWKRSGEVSLTTTKDKSQVKSESPLLPKFTAELNLNTLLGIDTKNGGRIRSALNSQYIENITIAENLSQDEIKLANAILEPMQTCGFDIAGGLCNKFIVESLSYIGSAEDIKEDNLIAIQMKIKGEQAPVILAYKVSGLSIAAMMNNGQLTFSKADSVKLYKVQRTFSPYDLVKTYLANKDAVVELGGAVISRNALSVSMEKAESAKTMEEYHYAMKNLFANKSVSDGMIGRSEFRKLIENNKNLAASSNDSNNQLAALNVLDSEIGIAYNSIVGEFCGALVATKNPSVQQAGAACVLERDSTSKDQKIRALVYQALNHERVQVRVRALKALTKASPSAHEINLILAKLNDNSPIVHRIARDYLVEEMVRPTHRKISEENLATLVGALGFSVSNSVKLYVIDAIARIEGAKAIDSLINIMKGTEADLAGSAAMKLDNKSALPEEVRVGLLKNIQNCIPEVQSRIISIISKKELSEKVRADLAKNLATYIPSLQEKFVDLIFPVSSLMKKADTTTLIDSEMSMEKNTEKSSVLKEVLANINNYAPNAQDAVMNKMLVAGYSEEVRLDILSRLTSFAPRIQTSLVRVISTGGLPMDARVNVLHNLNSYIPQTQDKLLDAIQVGEEFSAVVRTELLEKIPSYSAKYEEKLFAMVMNAKNGKETTAILVNALDHKSDTVKERIFKALSNRQITRELVASLRNSLHSSNKQTRINAAKIFTTSSNDVVNSRPVTALSERLAQEQDIDVRNQLEAAIRILTSKQ